MIRRLPQTLINQIAAGEVIVRPASVVKELVENAIDAGARHVRIVVHNENRDITVTDDGGGIGPAEAALALERHSTSKIERPADLAAIATRGFRGEALASIASVAKLELRTRTADTRVGSRVVVWGGSLQDQSQLGCPVGTTVEVRDLFYNVPARRKFMKTKASEWSHIAAIVMQQALSENAIGFRLENDGRLVYDLPAGQSSRDRFVQLAGPQLADQLLEVAYDRAGVTVNGLVALPAAARKDRRHQHFFVNGRPVSNRSLSFSLQEAYRGLLMTQRYPVVLLFITVGDGEVDVNVHPTKEEIRFQDERKISGLLNRAVVDALQRADLKPAFDLAATQSPPGKASPKPGTTGERSQADYQELFSKAARDLHFDGTLNAGPQPKSPSATDMQSDPDPATDIPDAVPLTEAKPTPRLPQSPAEQSADLADIHYIPQSIGQLAQTYILAAAGDDLILVDQHAAHERLLFMALLAKSPDALHIQPLLLPVTIELDAVDQPAMDELAVTLRELGFELDPFGGRTYIVGAVPAELADVNVEALIRDLLDDVMRDGQPRETRELKERVAARVACHSAIRAGQTLQREEMDRLLHDLYTTPTTYTCPHGRPTIIRLSKDDIDKQFGRKG